MKMQTHISMEKHSSPLSHKSTQCSDYLPCHSGAICSYHKADYLTPTAGCVCGFAIFSQIPTLLFVEMLPSWHRLKYVCVCVDVCIWVSVCGGAGLCVCLVGGWVFVWNGRLLKWRDGWHKQGRVVGGWCQGPTPTTRLDAVSDSWLRVCRPPLYTVPAKGQHFNQLRSLDASLTAAEPPFVPFMHT